MIALSLQPLFLTTAHLARQESLILAVLAAACAMLPQIQQPRQGFWFGLLLGGAALIHPNALFPAVIAGLVLLWNVLVGRLSLKTLLLLGAGLAVAGSLLVALSLWVSPGFSGELCGIWRQSSGRCGAQPAGGQFAAILAPVMAAGQWYLLAAGCARPAGRHGGSGRAGPGCAVEHTARRGSRARCVKQQSGISFAWCQAAGNWPSRSGWLCPGAFCHWPVQSDVDCFCLGTAGLDSGGIACLGWRSVPLRLGRSIPQLLWSWLFWLARWRCRMILARLSVRGSGQAWIRIRNTALKSGTICRTMRSCWESECGVCLAADGKTISMICAT